MKRACPAGRPGVAAIAMETVVAAGGRCSSMNLNAYLSWVLHKLYRVSHKII